MDSKYREVVVCKCYVSKELHEEFTDKILNEGWTVQQALHSLIVNYVDGNFDIKEDN